MSSFTAAVICPLLLAQPVAVAEVPKYSSCLEWAAAVAPKNGTVLIASQENGYLFCVFLTDDGRLAFCPHEFPRREGNDGTSIDLTNENGESVRPFGSPITPIVREWLIRSPNATVVTREIQGSIYSLVENPPRRVRIRFEERGPRGTKPIVAFDHVVDLRPNEK